MAATESGREKNAEGASSVSSCRKMRKHVWIEGERRLAKRGRNGQQTRRPQRRKGKEVRKEDLRIRKFGEMKKWERTKRIDEQIREQSGPATRTRAKTPVNEIGSRWSGTCLQWCCIKNRRGCQLVRRISPLGYGPELVESRMLSILKSNR